MKRIVFQLLRKPDVFGHWLRFAEEDGCRVGVVFMQDHDPATTLPQHCGFQVSHEDLQGLANVLWENGIRPSGYSVGISPALHDAMVAHLEDLRKIVVGSNG